MAAVRPLALLCQLCLLSLQCSSYRVVDRDSSGHGLRTGQDEFNPTATQRMFRMLGRSFNRNGNIGNIFRNQLLHNPQRSFHMRSSNLESRLLRDLQQMQRSQNLGKYRFSTFKGRKTLLPQNLMPMVSRRLMSTKEAKRFGKVFKDYLAKRDMRDARMLKEGGQDGRCTKAQMKEFTDRFYSGKSAINGALSYNHPSSKFTSLYIVTSAEGDHNGAFAGLEGGAGQRGFWNMCARLLQMSSLYNVVYKRVNTLAEATEFVKEVKNDPDFVKDGKALKHVTISGHGNPSTLVLGEDRMVSRELTSSRNTETKALLKELKPALIHTGEARSTVFLDSCSTGKTPKSGAEPLAQLVANALPGVEVHAFEDIMYPKWVELQKDFVDNAEFQCQWSMKGKCMQASVFMSKGTSTEPVRNQRYDQPDAYLEISRANVSVQHDNEDDEFLFYDGVSFMADPQMCAEWCGMILECHSFQFVELLDDEALDLGMCVLKAAPLQSMSPDELDLVREFDFESLD